MAKTDKELKELTLKEFNKAAEQFDNDDPSVYNLCRKDYPDILEELEKEEFTDHDAASYSDRTDHMWNSDDVIYDQGEEIWHGNDYGSPHWCVSVDHGHGFLAGCFWSGLWTDHRFA